MDGLSSNSQRCTHLPKKRSLETLFDPAAQKRYFIDTMKLRGGP
jgi:hypothetical protein